MHANVTLTNKRRTHAQSNYTICNTKRLVHAPLTPSNQETERAYSTPPDPHTAR